MKKSFFAIVFGLFCSLSFPVHCKTQDLIVQVSKVINEMESLSNTLDRKEKEIKAAIIDTNLKFIEKKLSKKLKRAESQLAKHRISLENAQDDSETQSLLKKIKAKQNTIEGLTEALQTIYLWKERFVK